MTNLDTKIIDLSKNNEDEQIEQSFEEQLKKEPDNIELWSQLAVFKMQTPIVNRFKNISFFDKILAIDKDNALATLLIARSSFYYFGRNDTDEALKDKLLALNPENNELNSMLKYIASWFYFGKDDTMEEQLLKASINLYQGHVWNYVYLAQLYFIQGRNKDAKELIEKALKNVRKVYTLNNRDWDKTNVHDFLNEHINGTYLSDVNLEDIKNCVNPKNHFDLKILELSKCREKEKIEQLFEEKLKQEPDNIDLLLRFTILEIWPPFVDYEKCFTSLNKVFALDKNNALAAIILAYVYVYVRLTGITEELKDKFLAIHTNNAELNSMLKYVASWFYGDIYEGNNPALEEQLLKESIELYQGHVYNYEKLAQLYINQGRNVDAKILIEKALSNVKKIYPVKNRVYDLTNVNQFLNECIKGIYLGFGYRNLQTKLKEIIDTTVVNKV